MKALFAVGQRGASVFAAFAAAAVLFISSPSRALPVPEPGCGTGPACAYGFECAQTGTLGCAPSVPCTPAEACPAAEPCTTTVEYGCVPARCTVDTDCGSDMVCHGWAQPCAVTDCACPADTPSCGCGSTVCEPQTVSLCTPRYELPCKVAADCGPGFICEQTQSCGCASVPIPGGGGTSGSQRAAPPDCSCQPSGEMECVAMDIACQTAAQCPAGWTCVVENIPAGAPACAPGADCPPPAAPSASSKCVPPYYGGQSGGDLQVPSTLTSGVEIGSADSGSAGTSSTSTPNKGTPAPTPTGSGEAHEVSACAMGRAPASRSALMLLVLLGALGSLKRRGRG